MPYKQTRLRRYYGGYRKSYSSYRGRRGWKGRRSGRVFTGLRQSANPKTKTPIMDNQNYFRAKLTVRYPVFYHNQTNVDGLSQPNSQTNVVVSRIASKFNPAPNTYSQVGAVDCTNFVRWISLRDTFKEMNITAVGTQWQPASNDVQIQPGDNNIPQPTNPLAGVWGLVDAAYIDTLKRAHDQLLVLEMQQATASKTYTHFNPLRPYKSYLNNRPIAQSEQASWMRTDTYSTQFNENPTPKRTFMFNTRNTRDINRLLGFLYVDFYVVFRGLRAIAVSDLDDDIPQSIPKDLLQDPNIQWADDDIHFTRMGGYNDGAHQDLPQIEQKEEASKQLVDKLEQLISKVQQKKNKDNTQNGD